MLQRPFEEVHAKTGIHVLVHPLDERRLDRSVGEQGVSHGDRADSVIRVAAVAVKQIEFGLLNGVEFVPRSDDVADDRTEHMPILLGLVPRWNRSAFLKYPAQSEAASALPFRGIAVCYIDRRDAHRVPPQSGPSLADLDPEGTRTTDRKSVGLGKSVSERVNIGGRRTM